MLTDKRIFITGANGFIGRNLIERLREMNVDIGVIKRKGVYANTGTGNNFKEFIGDIEDSYFVETAIKEFQPHVVFHLAANKNRTRGIDSLHQAIATNLAGTLNVFQSLAKLKNLESVITIGTIDEYGSAESPFHESQIEQPFTAYGLSKVYATKLAGFFFRTKDLPVIVLRPSIAYGPWQGDEMFIPSLVRALLKDETYSMTAGEQKRDFIFISDLIDVMLQLAKPGIGEGQIFNVGFGESVKINEVAKIVASKLSKMSLLKIGSLDYREGEMMDYSISIQKISDCLGWTPKVTLDEGLDGTIKHYKKFI